MNVWILYESRLGNTAQLADKIAQAMVRSARVRLLSASQAGIPTGVDLLLIGVPSHRHSRPDAVFDWLRRLPVAALNGVKFSVFDVRFMPSRWFQTSTAIKVGRAILRRGGQYACPPESFYLSGHEGPLAEGEQQRAIGWASHMVREFK